MHYHWVQAGDAATRVLANVVIAQMADILIDRTVDLENPEEVILALIDARFSSRLIHSLMDRAIDEARRERGLHAHAAS